MRRFLFVLIHLLLILVAKSEDEEDFDADEFDFEEFLVEYEDEDDIDEFEEFLAENEDEEDIDEFEEFLAENEDEEEFDEFEEFLAENEDEEEFDEFEEFLAEQENEVDNGFDSFPDRETTPPPTAPPTTSSSPAGVGEIGAFDPHPYPIIESFSQSQTMTVGDSVEFACSAYDIADHLPNWPKHDLTIEIIFETDLTRDLTSTEHGWWIDSFVRSKARPSFKTGRIDIHETAEVTAYKQRLEKSDEGWYRCRACIYEDTELQACDYNNAKFYLQVNNPRGAPDEPVPDKTKPNNENLAVLETSRSSCQVFGDPHIISFDGMSYNFPGTSCDYVMALDRTGGSFFVYGRMRPCGKIAQGVCLESITLYAKGDAIELQRGWIVNHKGQKVETAELKEPTKVGEFEVSFEGTTLVVGVLLKESVLYGLRMQDWLRLHWDGLTAVTIEVPQTAQTQGLCGDNDFDASNDYDVWGTINNDAMVLSESMKVDWAGTCGAGVPAHTKDQIKQICGIKKYKKAQEKCGKIFGAHEFQACEHDVDKSPYVEACVYDQCKGMNLSNDLYPWMVIPKIDKVLVPGCNAAEAYAMKCSLRTHAADGSVVGGIAMVDWEHSTHLCVKKSEKLRYIPKLGCPQSFMKKN